MREDLGNITLVGDDGFGKCHFIVLCHNPAGVTVLISISVRYFLSVKPVL